MMKKIIFFTILISGTILLITNLFLGVEQKNLLFPYIDTHFAKNFSVNKWDNVKIGMSKDTVLKILGTPLLESKTPFSSYRPSCAALEMHYSGDGAWRYADYAWRSFDLFFDDSNRVIAKSSEWSYD